jgi:PAS domain S-box-containing protein
MALRWPIHRFFHDPISYELYFLAIVVSARYGGTGPGVAAMVMGGLAADYFFVPPSGFSLHQPDNLVGFCMYMLVGSVILKLHHSERQERRRAEEGQATLDAVLEHIPEGVTIADAPDARVRRVSRWGAELGGREPKEFVGLSPEEHRSAWSAGRAGSSVPAKWEDLPLTRAVRKGEVVRDEEWILKRRDGSAIPVLCNAAPIRDTEGHITGGMSVFRDLSQRKELEEKLLEAAKLESLGVLAGGIAHDYNNLLTSIMGYASLLAGSMPEGSLGLASARAVLDAAEAAARLTRQMLAYSGRSRFVIEAVNLTDLVRRNAELIHASAPNVQADFDLSAQLPAVAGDAAQLQQLLINIVMNASEAVGTAGGRVRIGTGAMDLGDADIKTLLGADRAAPGPHVMLEVQDTGAGMDPAILARIFDPFFTTKEMGRGLGLAAVMGIVRGHRGGIKVDTAPGAGTTFRVYLPANLIPAAP